MMAETTVPYPAAPHPTDNRIDDPRDCTRVYQTLLTQARLPAAVIDSASAEIVAANTAGLAVLDLAQGAPFPIKLDSAAPAIATLREISAAGALKPVERTLAFRRNGAIAHHVCNLAIAHASHPSHILVVFRETETEAPAPLVKLTGEDVAKLAHELKTPLAAIAAAAEIMRDERLGAIGNAKYHGYASDIHDSAAHAIAVIENLLTAGTADAERKAKAASFDLSDLAARTRSALEPFADARGLRLVHHRDRDALLLTADVTSIRQILLNLLSNAIKFTPAGGEIHITTCRLSDGTPYLSVRDTGTGMDEAAMVNALADSETGGSHRPGGGQGIGLSLVRRLATENGATLKIDSASGHGTIASITFDRRR